MRYLWKIIGHQKLLFALEKDIESGNMAHAYLFAGPDYLGKYTVAKSLAKILQCPNNYCHSCTACIQIEKGSHIDTIEFRDDGESIKIEQVRTVIERLHMSPQARYKILLLENIERATREAQNALLKILEEPPPQTIFLFTSAHAADIPQTILSRVRKLQFHLFSDAYLRVCLKEKFPDADTETIRQASLFSFGKSGRALQLLAHPEMLHEYQSSYREIEHLLSTASAAARFRYAQMLADEENREKIYDALHMMLHIIRSRVLRADGNRQKFTPLARVVYKTEQLIKKNVNARFALEHLMLQL